ncbi:MAG: N-formylglutamate amidohydrolase [Pseudomonadota bacterium]
MSKIVILDHDEPHPVRVHREHGLSPFFLTCDHAGKRIPRKLGDLGLPAHELERHIAWDIGALATSAHLSARLDATLVEQVYSRLVVDCNRKRDMPTFVTEVSEATEIPGNMGLRDEHVAAREREIHTPYHDRIVDLMNHRERTGRPNVLIAMHSFTPIFHGNARPWHIGLLYNRDDRLAAILHDVLTEHDVVVGDNEPYAISDDSDYGIPVHGEERGVPHIEFEIRQDLIADDAGQKRWAALLEDVLRVALQRLEAHYPEAVLAAD